MRKATILAIITEVLKTGSCYIGSFEPDFAEKTNKRIESIERYIHRNCTTVLDTKYINIGTDCYMVIK